MSKKVRYTANDISANRFYQMPKFLFEGELKSLSNNARVLYCLLRDRHELSLKNQWINKDNEVYLIYTRKAMQDMLGLADKTVKKTIEQLKEYGLMEEERIGCNRANRIYLTAVDIENTGVVESTIPDQEELRFQNRKNDDSEVVENTILDSYNLRPINTYSSKTDISDTDSSQINPSISNIKKVIEEYDGQIDKKQKESVTQNKIIDPNEIIKELRINKGIPYQYKADKDKMIAAIHYLSDYNTLSHGFDDEIKQASYNLAINTLIDMAVYDNTMDVNGAKINYKHVIDKINDSIDSTHDNLSIDSFVHEIVDDYSKAIKSREIKNLVAYMRSCIWNSLLNHKVKFGANVHRILEGYGR